ncbi:unnamed protein product [Chrysoparadoxa australica]
MGDETELVDKEEEDPELLEELAGLSGGGKKQGKQGEEEIMSLEKIVAAKKREAMVAKASGDINLALQLMRDAKAMEQEQRVRQTLLVAATVASSGKVKAEEAPGAGAPEVDAAEKAAALRKKALALKKQGNIAEAVGLLKRAKSVEVQAGLAVPAGRGSHGGNEPLPLGVDDDPPLLVRRTSRGSRADSNVVEKKSGSSSGSIRLSERRRSSRDKNGSAAAAAVTPAAPTPSLPPRTTQPAEGAAAGFEALEQALVVAIKSYAARAKELLSSDRVAAAVEGRKFKDLQAQLAKLREVRTIPGAAPPHWRWALLKKSRIRVMDGIAIDQLQLEIAMVHGLADKFDGKAADIYVQYDLWHSKVEADRVGSTSVIRCNANQNSMEVNYLAEAPLSRTRSTQVSVQHRKASFEVAAYATSIAYPLCCLGITALTHPTHPIRHWHVLFPQIHRKRGLFRSPAFVAKAVVPLNPLLTTCELVANAPLMGEGRKDVGGYMEVRLRVRKPLQGDEVLTVEEKELEIGPWPENLGGSLPDALFVPLPPQQQGQPEESVDPPAPPPEPEPVPMPVQVAETAAVAASAKGGPDLSILTEDEKRDPLAPAHIDSNDVLEAEIEACGPIEEATPDAAARRGMLELKMACLVNAVQSGELDVAAYCKILEERVHRDGMLALYLKGEGRMKEALAVMRRIRVMRDELSSANEDSEEVEDE